MLKHVRTSTTLVVGEGNKLGVSGTEIGETFICGTCLCMNSERCTARMTLILMGVTMEGGIYKCKLVSLK